MIVACNRLCPGSSTVGRPHTTAEQVPVDQVDQRTSKRRNLKDLLVRWEGHDPVNDWWEPEANIHEPTQVQDYWNYVASREQHTAQQAKQPG